MRIVLICLALAASASAALAQTAPFGQPGMSRPGGAYSTIAADSPALCAQQCDADRLCMAWDYQASRRQCDLKAVTPRPIPAPGFISGLSARAPDFARAMAPPAPIQPPAAEAAIAPAPPSLAETRAAAPNVEPPPPNVEPPPSSFGAGDDELLGGPAGIADIGLKPRIPGQY